jgi:hypothetical protein
MEEKLSEITSIPTGLQILLKDLDYLAQIPRGLKPCVNSRDFVDDNTWGGWFYRTFIVKESRKDVLAEVEKIVERAVEAIKNHKDTDYILVLIQYFYKARSGVSNLLATYKGSPDIVSRINVQLTNMDIQIKRYQRYIDGYKIEDNVKASSNPLNPLNMISNSKASNTPNIPNPPSPPSTLKESNLDLFSSDYANSIPNTPNSSNTKRVKKHLKLKKSTDFN